MAEMKNIQEAAAAAASAEGENPAMLWDPVEITAMTRYYPNCKGGGGGGGGAGGCDKLMVRKVEFISELGGPVVPDTGIFKLFNQVNEAGFAFIQDDGDAAAAAAAAAAAPASPASLEKARQVNAEMKENKKNIPFYFIQCHGEFEAPIKIIGADSKKVVWGRGAGDSIKMTGKNQWIIQNAPLGFLGQATQGAEDTLVRNIGRYFLNGPGGGTGYKDRLISPPACDPEATFKNIEENKRRITGVPMYTPPYCLYPNKLFQVYDGIGDIEEWDFAMLVIPIFQPMDLDNLQKDWAYEKHPHHLEWLQSIVTIKEAELAKMEGGDKEYAKAVEARDDAANALKASVPFIERQQRRDKRHYAAGGGGGGGAIPGAYYPWKMHYADLYDDFGYKYKQRGVERREADTDVAGGGNGFRHKSLADQLGRLQVNRQIAENDAYWVAGSTNIYWPRDKRGELIPTDQRAMQDALRKCPSQGDVDELRVKYHRLVCAWEARVPGNAPRAGCRVVENMPGVRIHAEAGAGGGGAQGAPHKLSELMSIFGEGIYLPINCSPALLVTGTGSVGSGGGAKGLSQTQQAAQIMYAAYYDFVDKIVTHSLNVWKFICNIMDGGGGDGGGAALPRVKLQITADDLPLLMMKPHAMVTRRDAMVNKAVAFAAMPDPVDYRDSGDDDDPSSKEKLARKRVITRDTTHRFIKRARQMLTGLYFTENGVRWKVTGVKFSLWEDKKLQHEYGSRASPFRQIYIFYEPVARGGGGGGRSKKAEERTPLDELINDSVTSNWSTDIAGNNKVIIEQSFKAGVRYAAQMAHAAAVKKEEAKLEKKGVELVKRAGKRTRIPDAIREQNKKWRECDKRVFGALNYAVLEPGLTQEKFQDMYDNKMEECIDASDDDDDEEDDDDDEQGGGSRRRKKRRRKRKKTKKRKKKSRKKKKTRKRKKSRRKRRKTRRKYTRRR